MAVKIDLRIKKTHKALYDSIYSILSRRNFNNITVHDICTEALVSRAAFYSHFRDKYELLEYFLTVLRGDIIKDIYKYEELEREINQFIDMNKLLISNVLKDADRETLDLVNGFMSSIVELIIEKKGSDKKSPNYIILFNFLVGGLVNLLMWIVENGYPPEVTIMNDYLYKMLEAITLWDAEQDKKIESFLISADIEKNGDKYLDSRKC